MSGSTENPNPIARLIAIAQHSVRIRLALWHTFALAILLSAFAAGGYVYLERTTRLRSDRLLAETVSVFTATWTAERAETPEAPIAASARDAMQSARYQDRRIAVYDDKGTLLALSDSAPLSPHFSVAQLDRVTGAPLAGVVRAARDAGEAVSTLGRDDEWIRARAVSSTIAGRHYVIVGLRDLRADDAITETFLNWLTITLPLALLLSGGGGYLIARRTLMPVVAIARDAEQISAQSLDARLTVPNPADELGELAGVLNRLLGRLEVSFDQQRQFMADASHELRTPVAVLRSAADIALANDHRTAEELRHTLRLVSNEGRRLTRVVEDLFLLARADAGQQPLRTEQLYLEELLHDAAQAARALAASHSIMVVCKPADESPFTGDAALLSRVVMNLAHNAVKHTPDGGTVTLRLTRSDDDGERASTGEDAPMYRIRVENTGPGIPEALHARIFDRFVRSDPARSRGKRPDSSGAGLGLSIARWIAEVHNGSVRLEFSTDRGSCFVFSLPVPASSARVARASIAVRDAGDASSSERLTDAEHETPAAGSRMLIDRARDTDAECATEDAHREADG